MEERIKYSLLLDLYEEMLTDKQKEVLKYYYFDDLSISEISELSSTSRQAAFDVIKKCNKQLLNYESKLHLYEKNLKMKKDKEKIYNEINVLKLNICDKNLLDRLDKIKKIIEDF